MRFHRSLLFLFISLIFSLPTLLYAQEGPVEDDQSEDPPTLNTTPPPLRKEAEKPTKTQPEEDKNIEHEVVVITGTGVETALTQVPVRTQVIGRETIETRNANSLADSLRHTSGVRLETNCQNCGFTQLRLNGLEGHYTQILIDGLPTYSGLAGVYGLEQIPAEMIERVEIVKGGGSSLYGGNAIAGVVNVITRRPKKPFAHGHVEYGSVGLRQPELRLSTDAAVTNEDNTASAFFFASTQRRDGVDLNGDGFTELTRIRRVAGGANVFWSPRDEIDIDLGFHALQEYRRGGDNLDLPPHEAEIAEELQTERLQGHIRFKHVVSAHFDYSLAYAVAYTERRSYYGGGGLSANPTLPSPNASPAELEEFRTQWDAKQAALGGYGRTENPTHSTDARGNIYIHTERPMMITFGGQVNVDDVKDSYLGYQRVIDAVYTVGALYAQHDWFFASWGESILGIRIDQHSELDQPVISPRAALMLTPTESMRLRSSFSTGFRAPQAFDEDLHIETVGGSARLIENSSDLRTERSLSFAQNIDWSHPFTGGWTLRASIHGYLTVLHDAFVVNERDDPSTPEEEALRENRGETQVIGVETEVRAEYRNRLSIRAGWTFEHTHNDEPDEDFLQTRLLRTPNHYGYAELNLRPSTRLSLQSGVDITGPMLTPKLDRRGDPISPVASSPWFADVSLHIAYTINPTPTTFIEPFLGARNLIDSRQKDFDTGPNRDSNYVYGPALPRSVQIGVEGGF